MGIKQNIRSQKTIFLFMLLGALFSSNPSCAMTYRCNNSHKTFSELKEQSMNFLSVPNVSCQHRSQQAFVDNFLEAIQLNYVSLIRDILKETYKNPNLTRTHIQSIRQGFFYAAQPNRLNVIKLLLIYIPLKEISQFNRTITRTLAKAKRKRCPTIAFFLEGFSQIWIQYAYSPTGKITNETLPKSATIVENQLQQLFLKLALKRNDYLCLEFTRFLLAWAAHHVNSDTISFFLSHKYNEFIFTQQSINYALEHANDHTIIQALQNYKRKRWSCCSHLPPCTIL